MQQTLFRPVNNSAAESRQVNGAVEANYELLRRELSILFYAFCNDSERASDAVQEAFLRLQRQDVNEIRNPRDWLLHVGRNWLRDVARNKKKAAVSGGNLREIQDDRQSAMESCVRSESRQIVRDALNHLTERDRLILVLRFGLQWPANRIAETLECKPGAVDMRLSRARLRLRDVLVEMHADFADAEI